MNEHIWVIEDGESVCWLCGEHEGQCHGICLARLQFAADKANKEKEDSLLTLLDQLEACLS